MRISDEELAAALAENIDADGNDIGLEAEVAAWTPEQREASERNLREWSTAMRAAMKRCLSTSVNYYLDDNGNVQFKEPDERP